MSSSDVIYGFLPIIVATNIGDKNRFVIQSAVSNISNNRFS